MHPRFRSFLSPLLGVVLLMGHAPAWLHMGLAGGGCCRSDEVRHAGAPAHCGISSLKVGGAAASTTPSSRVANEKIASEPGGCCCHHHVAKRTTQAPVGGSDWIDESLGPDRHHHDSHHCWICQSVTAPTGVSANAVVWMTSVPFEGEFVRAHERVCLDETLFLPLSRGPPANDC